MFEHPLASYLTCPLLGYAAYYALKCTVSPFGPCRRCRNTPHKRSRRQLCHRCDGTGYRVRLGRRAWTHITREHREGNR